MNNLTSKWIRFPGALADPPQRKRPDDAGYDLQTVLDFELLPDQKLTVATGYGIILDYNQAGLVIPRSGLADQYSLTVVNAPGLIDPNYRGEIKVVLQNLGERVFQAKVGDRIAQLLIVDFVTNTIEEVVDLEDLTRIESSDRGGEGFGSSGR